MYKRGPVIPDLETLVFCLMHGDHIYHGTAILPTAQYFSWSLAKLRNKIKEEKLHFAEVK